MAIYFFHRLNISFALFLLHIVFVSLCFGCIKQHEQVHPYTQNNAPSVPYSGACIDVDGKVQGDIIPDSKVFLYRKSCWYASQDAVYERVYTGYC